MAETDKTYNPEESAPLGKLTPKMIRFCEEYMIDLNASQAAIRAGYSENSAGEIGYENLNKPQIRAYLDKRMQQRADSLQLNQDWVLQKLMHIADRSMKPEPLMKFDPVEKQMVQATDEDGNLIFVYDSTGANRAAELIGKHLGMFNKPLEVKLTGADEFVITSQTKPVDEE